MSRQQSFQLGYQEALNDIARALAQAGERGVREWLENNRHDHEIGGDDYPEQMGGDR